MDLLFSDVILLREREYFSSRVHEDINAIMEDIREAHQGRSESGPDYSTIAEFKQDIEDVANFKGSRAEMWLMLYCNQTKDPYHKLTEEEKQWLMRIAQKSKLGKAMFHRGKRNRNRRAYWENISSFAQGLGVTIEDLFHFSERTRNDCVSKKLYSQAFEMSLRRTQDGEPVSQSGFHRFAGNSHNYQSARRSFRVRATARCP
ncbi:MAG: hypothetical protein NC548_57930 [Lachnospiraceae bacterium]|nr:hypothetical protein [Lachnospiraceae bacterium]